MALISAPSFSTLCRLPAHSSKTPMSFISRRSAPGSHQRRPLSPDSEPQEADSASVSSSPKSLWAQWLITVYHRALDSGPCSSKVSSARYGSEISSSPHSRMGHGDSSKSPKGLHNSLDRSERADTARDRRLPELNLLFLFEHQRLRSVNHVATGVHHAEPLGQLALPLRCRTP